MTRTCSIYTRYRSDLNDTQPFEGIQEGKLWSVEDSPAGDMRRARQHSTHHNLSSLGKLGWLFEARLWEALLIVM